MSPPAWLGWPDTAPRSGSPVARSPSPLPGMGRQTSSDFIKPRNMGPAGMHSERQGSGFIEHQLRVSSDRSKLHLRGSGSPFVRPLRFASPGAGERGKRLPPGSTTAVPGSPRANSPCRSPRGSDDGFSAGGLSPRRAPLNLRGLPPGKLVTEVRQAPFAWPGQRGSTEYASHASVTDSQHEEMSQYGASHPRSPDRPGEGSAQARTTDRIGEVGAFARTADTTSEVSASARAGDRTGEVTAYSRGGDTAFGRIADRTGEAGAYPRVLDRTGDTRALDRTGDTLATKDRSGHLSAMPRDVMEEEAAYQTITTNEAAALATAAAAEAEAEADRRGDGPPPPLSPLYVQNPWRVGLTARTAERGAYRVFPVHLVTPHAVAKDVAVQGDPPASAGSSSTNTPRVIPPPETSANDSSYRRILPSSTTSITSTVSHTLSQAGPASDGSSSAPSEAATDGPPSGAAAKSSGSTAAASRAAGPAASRTARTSKAAAASRKAQAGAPVSDAPASVPDGGATLAQVADLLSAEVRQQRRADKAASGAGSDAGKAGKETSASARLKALRHKVERNLSSAEDNHSSKVDSLDRRMAGHRKSLGESSVSSTKS